MMLATDLLTLTHFYWCNIFLSLQYTLGPRSPKSTVVPKVSQGIGSRELKKRCGAQSEPRDWVLGAKKALWCPK